MTAPTPDPRVDALMASIETYRKRPDAFNRHALRLVILSALEEAAEALQQPDSVHSAAPTDQGQTEDALSDERLLDLARDECANFRWPSSALAIMRAAIAASRAPAGKAKT